MSAGIGCRIKLMALFLHRAMSPWLAHLQLHLPVLDPDNPHTGWCRHSHAHPMRWEPPDVGMRNAGILEPSGRCSGARAARIRCWPSAQRSSSGACALRDRPRDPANRCAKKDFLPLGFVRVRVCCVCFLTRAPLPQCGCIG
jgi:hypothetical protein